MARLFRETDESTLPDPYLFLGSVKQHLADPRPGSDTPEMDEGDELAWELCNMLQEDADVIGWHRPEKHESGSGAPWGMVNLAVLIALWYGLYRLWPVLWHFVLKTHYSGGKL